MKRESTCVSVCRLPRVSHAAAAQSHASAWTVRAAGFSSLRSPWLQGSGGQAPFAQACGVDVHHGVLNTWKNQPFLVRPRARRRNADVSSGGERRAAAEARAMVDCSVSLCSAAVEPLFGILPAASCCTRMQPPARLLPCLAICGALPQRLASQRELDVLLHACNARLMSFVR